MDWSEKNLCIKCNKGGNLLICSENGCPLATHEGCMGCPARLDDAGRFYCPYCLYKKAVAESRKAREYALERKKALLMFMDQDVIGSEKLLDENKRAEANGHHQSKDGEANIDITARNDGKSRSDNDADRSIHLDEGHKINDAEEEKVQEEDSEASAGSKGQDPSIELHEEQKITHEDGKTVEEEENETSAASSGEEPSVKMHEHEISNEKEESIQEEECETSSASTGQDTSLTLHERPKRGFERSKPINSDPKTVSVPSKRVKKSDRNKQTSPSVGSPRRSSRRSSSASRTEKMLNERVDISRGLKQAQKPSVKLSNDVFSSGKRKRLYWREEEEEKLKEGVQKYSIEGNKNLPWRKILEFGSDVFDKSRNPSDLKDKWRKMAK